MKRTFPYVATCMVICALASCAALKTAPDAGAPASGTGHAEALPKTRESEAAIPPPFAPSPESAPSIALDRGATKGLAGGATYSPAASVPSASGLKAGFSDDNAQFGYFVDFLKKYGDVTHFAYDISERITLRVVDSAGKPVANARVVVKAGAKQLAGGLTHSDGVYRVYPAALGTDAKMYDVGVDYGSLSARTRVDRAGARQVEIRLPGARNIPDPLPLDVLFVMDTTGSMGEEIARLKTTIEIIHANLSALKPRPLLRFGFVLYKDRGDEYITRIEPFTADLDRFQAALRPVTASGGGDGPEDLESALDDAVNAMDWNKDGLRLAFVITDAEAHLDYNREYTYIHAATDARDKAIKMYTIGTGGLPLEGEYLLRQVSQLSDARYIFLTYGERGEMEGGKEGSVSHHTGSNYQTDKLEAIIIRFVKEEVSNLSDTPLKSDDDYFSARKVDDETRDQTLGSLFGDAIANLADYSSYHVGPETPCVILPVSSSGEGLSATAEYFGERLAMASAAAGRWKLVERKDFQKILAELELQLSGLVDESSAARVGGLLGAELLVSSTLYRRGDGYELFLKLIRVSTAEVLSVSRARIALDLGL